MIHNLFTSVLSGYQVMVIFTDENQLLAVENGALPPLHHILTSCRSETLAAAAACLRNLSIHKLNEVILILLSIPDPGKSSTQTKCLEFLVTLMKIFIQSEW